MSEWRIVRVEWNAYDDEGIIRWYMFEFRVPEAVTLNELEDLKYFRSAKGMQAFIESTYKGECQKNVVSGIAIPVSGSYGSWFDLEDVTELYGDNWTL